MTRIQTLSALALMLPALALAQPPAGADSSPGARIDRFMSHMDANKNGKVEKAEFLKPFEMQFDMMDANKDGALERSEVEKFQQMMRQRMQQMRQHQGGGR